MPTASRVLFARRAATRSCYRFPASSAASLERLSRSADVRLELALKSTWKDGTRAIASGERVDTLKHRAPTRLDLEEIVTTVALRAIRWLERHGYLRSDGDEGPTENEDTASPWMRCLQGSLGVGELQRWVEHGSAEQSRGPARTRSLESRPK